MSEDADRRKTSLQKKYKQAIDDIIEGAKALTEERKKLSAEREKNELSTNKKKPKLPGALGRHIVTIVDPLSQEGILESGAQLEAEKKAEQLNAFLEEEVFEKITILESRIQELEDQLAAAAAPAVPGATGL